MDYTYYIDGKKASLADMKKYSIDMIASFKIKPEERRVDIVLNENKDEDIHASPFREM